MAAMETGEVVKATSPADDMKSGGSQDQELQSSPAKVSPAEEEEEELFARSLYYDIWMRLVVAHYIRKLKLDMEKDIWIHGSLLRDNAGESDWLRRSVSDSLMARESEPDDDDDDDDDDGSTAADVDAAAAGSEDEDDEKQQNMTLWEFRDMYAKASDVDRRMEEFNEIMWVHFDPDLEDPETRAATVERLWRRLEKELDDRADAVVSGAFNYSFESLAPSHQ
uniref:Uncharacterized protein n=1 Tax=Hordeum vulgare subsp. vulgare TaxID=112509 RepID=A0A8I6XYV9_HORVV